MVNENQSQAKLSMPVTVSVTQCNSHSKRQLSSVKRSGIHSVDSHGIPSLVNLWVKPLSENST